MSKSDGEQKILVGFRLERDLYHEVKNMAKATEWSESEVFRYLVKMGFIMLHPDVTIPAWKIAELISPIAIDEIRKGEELRRKIAMTEKSGDKS